MQLQGDMLKQHAQRFLEFGVSQMRKGRELLPMYQFVLADGGIEVVAVDPELMNSADAKQVLVDKVRARVQTDHLQAVLLLTDTFITNISKENFKVMQSLRIGIEEASALGLCERRESVFVMVDSPTDKWQLVQEYKRTPQGIEWLPLQIEQFETEGRMASYFPRPAGATEPSW